MMYVDPFDLSDSHMEERYSRACASAELILEMLVGRLDRAGLCSTADRLRGLQVDSPYAARLVLYILRAGPRPEEEDLAEWWGLAESNVERLLLPELLSAAA